MWNNLSPTIVLIALTISSGAAAEVVAAATAGRPALTVEVERPRRESWPALIHVDGDIAAWQEFVVSSASAGLRVTAVRVDIGDAIHRGDEPIEVDRSRLEGELAQRRAAVTAAEANMALVAADADRTLALRDSGLVTAQATEQCAARKRVAEAGLAAARADLAQAELVLAQSHIRAADDGIVVARPVRLGAVLNSGDELLRVLRQGRLEWRAEVVERDLAVVRPGQAAEIRLPGGRVVAGTVRAVAPQVDPQRRTAIAYVDLPADGLRPGMFAGGTIAVGAPADVLTLAEPCLDVRAGRPVAMVVDAQGQVHVRAVVTGRRRTGRVEIVSGLAVGDGVVAAGAAFLREGEQVRIVAEGRP